MNRIEIEVIYEDGSISTLTLPEKSNNSLTVRLLNNFKIIDRKELCLGDKTKLEFS